MAVTAPTLLGKNFSGTTSASSISTSATVPAGPQVLLIAVVHSYDTGSNDSFVVSGGGLTWQQDGVLTDTEGADRVLTAFWSAPAPSGLASATSITCTPTNSNGHNWELCYADGLDTSASRTDASSKSDITSGTTIWTTGAASLGVYDALIMAGAMADGTGATTATDAPAVELTDQVNTTHDWTTSISYLLAGAPASYTVTGTCTNSGFGANAALLAYKSVAADLQYTVTLERQRGPGLRGPGHENEAVGFIA